ncbi:MAG: S8 family serine peptidase, partial [Promethearchaeota archaeon]
MSVKTLSKNSLRKIRLKGLFLSFVIIISVFSNFHSLNYNFFRIFYINPITDFKSYYSEEVMLSNHSDMIPIDLKELNIVDLYTWRESLLNADENLNGINDQFELKLDKFKDSTITTSSEIENKKYIAPDEILKDLSGSINQLESNTLSSEELSIIIQFPECNYEPISSLFEDLGGIIHFEYKSALNGFAGKVDYNAFNDFISILNKNEIPFFIEEDLECKTELYYSSRNMNLRPYVWKNLTNTGDRYSSIAILDTGIDDTHPLFSPGYSDGDFTSKIVGWNDQVNGISAPYDDHGHGSHCSGIAAGNGNLSLDTNGRTVATHGLNIDYRGSYVDPQILETIASRFQVTDPGIVEIECLYNDLTPGVDNVELHVFLYHDEVIVDEFTTSASSWTHTLSYIVTSGDLGDYSLRYAINFIDGDSDDYCRSPYFGIRGVIHWPFNPELFDINEPFKGVAPDAKLVGVKVMDEKGSGLTSCLLAGINWVVYNKIKYNITTISMSLGYDSDGETSVINAVNNAVDQGIVVVTSAGNRGPEGNHIGSPGDADKVITVAAMGNDDRVTSYSSQGSSNKPDIMAPGGSRLSGTFFSADSNDYDAGIQFADGYPDDLASMQGTSMACPAVAGAVNLLIEAMGGHQNWNYTAIEVLRIKALLLMSATETYPLMRELSTEQYSPLLNRGGRDAHEGYGRMNVDIALETITQNLDINSEKSMIISSSVIDPFEKHGFGCNLDLIKGVNYKLKLNVPDGVDFDLHLYSSSPNDIGLPIMVASSISSALGEDEIIDFIPTTTGKYYLIVKAIYGSGNASVSFLPNEFAPSLTNEKLTPHSEFQNHIFNFSITYNDADNFHPAYINVVVNGTPHAMQKVDPLDNNYEDGCVFQYLTYFQPALHNYTYYFECSDGAFIDTTSIHNDLEVNEINNLAPLLSEGHVSPQIGYNGSTLFTFFVNYTDQDNNMPTSVNLI